MSADRRLSLAVIAVGVLPSLWAAWLLWLSPLDGLTADRAALAARDFTPLWAAGRLASENALPLLSDPARFTSYLRDLFGLGMPAQIWPYPPSILVLARLVAEAPLAPAFALYSGFCLSVLALALAAGRLSPVVIVALLFSPALATNLLAGQNGALVATFLAGGLLVIDRRPILAGLLFGLLSAKPQFALLLPFCLIAAQRWQTVAATALSALALTLVSLVLFGFDPWVEFLTTNHATVTTYAEASWQANAAQSIFSSVFMTARSLGAGVQAAYAAQSIATATAALVAWRLWSNQAIRPQRRIAATLALALIAAPWVHTYDMPALAVAVALLIGDQSRWRRAALGFVWLWPGLSLVVPCYPLVSLVCAVAVVWIAIVPVRAPALRPSLA